MYSGTEILVCAEILKTKNNKACRIKIFFTDIGLFKSIKVFAILNLRF
jgi:hypothetical protein